MKQIVLLLFFFPVFIYAQEKAKLTGKLEGTYQVEFLKTATQPVAITGELLEKIEKLREDSKVVYFVVNDQCRIKIFPKNNPKAADKNLSQEYVVVEKFTNE